MSIGLYYAPMSPPCRAVLLTAEAIGLTLNLKLMDVLNGENQTPEYEQMNPQKTVPLLVDDDYKLHESRAIMGYLVDEYGDNEQLYPTTPEARAVVNQRMHFDMGILYKNIAEYYFPVLLGNQEEFDAALLQKINKAFEALEMYLEDSDYVTGDDMTIADLTLIATVTTAEVCGFDLSKYEKVEKWVERMKTNAPGYSTANGEGVEMLRKKVFNEEE